MYRRIIAPLLVVAAVLGFYSVVFAKNMKPEEAVIKYVEAYLKRDWEGVNVVDFSQWERVINAMNSAPKSINDEVMREKRRENYKYLNDIEEVKLRDGKPFTNPLNPVGGGGGMLFNILFPGMKYKVLEVRDKQNTMLTESLDYQKEAFVELIYTNKKYSPFEYSKGQLKKGIIKVMLIKVSQGGEIKYKVLRYMPTNYKQEFF